MVINSFSTAKLAPTIISSSLSPKNVRPVFKGLRGGFGVFFFFFLRFLTGPGATTQYQVVFSYGQLCACVSIGGCVGGSVSVSVGFSVKICVIAFALALAFALVFALEFALR